MNHRGGGICGLYVVVKNLKRLYEYCKRRYFRAVKFSHTYPSEAYSRNQKFAQLIYNSLCYYMILIFAHTIFSRIYQSTALREMCENMYCAKISTFTLIFLFYHGFLCFINSYNTALRY